MNINQVSKSKFKKKALEYLRQIESSGQCVIVTDRGRPIVEVRLYRYTESNPLEILKNSVLHYGNPLSPVDDECNGSD